MRGFGPLVILVLSAVATGRHTATGLSESTVLSSSSSIRRHHDVERHARDLQGFSLGGTLTKAPSSQLAGQPTSVPTRTPVQQPRNPSMLPPRGPPKVDPDATKEATVSFVYHVYTSLATVAEGAQEVHAFLRDQLDGIVADIGDENVRIVRYTEAVLDGACAGPPSDPPDWVDASFALCARYNATIEIELARTWDEDVFERTTTRTMHQYIREWNGETRTTYVRFDWPIQVTAPCGILLVGAARLMTIYEYTLLADALQIRLGPEGSEHSNPPFTITSVEFVWQRIVENDGTVSGGGRLLQQGDGPNGDPTNRVLSNQVQMMVVAQCPGQECTDANLEAFVQASIPEINDVVLASLERWSETNYFESVDSIKLSTSDGPRLVDPPVLPPDSDHRSSGVQEHDSPLWIWFAIIIAAGIVVLACVWAMFTLTARDYQAARKQREHRRERTQDKDLSRPASQHSVEQPRDFAPPGREPSSEVFRTHGTPVTDRYFSHKTRNSRSHGAGRVPEQEEDLSDMNEFDVSESEAKEGGDIREVPPSMLGGENSDVRTASKTKKKSKGKKKKKKSSTGEVQGDEQEEKKSRKKSSKKKKIAEATDDDVDLA